MPRCSGLTAPILRSCCACNAIPRSRHFSYISAHRAAAAVPKHDKSRTIDAEHAALIDPGSLRDTLDAVRDANRTRLIRKVGSRNGSKRLSLPTLLDIPLKTPSTDAAIIEGTALPRIPDRLPGAQAGSRAVPSAKTEMRKRKRKRRAARRAKLAGRVPPLVPEWETNQSTPMQCRLPWLSHVDPELLKGHQPSMSRLAAELDAFNQFFSVTAPEQAAATEAIDDLKQFLAWHNPEMSVDIIGSRATGIASPLSDIDVNLTPRDKPRPDVVAHRFESKMTLHKLVKAIRPRSIRTNARGDVKFTITSVVGSARVPIVILHHMATGLEVQIQHTNDGFNTTEYAKSFLREYPSLKALFLVIRQMLAIRGLSDGAMGGLGSYPLLNMIVASLRSHDARGGDPVVADQLLHFFDLYSEFNFSETGIRVCPYEQVERGYNLPADRPELSMYFEDPADPTNILGKAATRIRDIQATFIALRTELQNSMKAWDDEQQAVTDARSHTSNGQSLLSVLLDADYRRFQLTRAVMVHNSSSSSE